MYLTCGTSECVLGHRAQARGNIEGSSQTVLGEHGATGISDAAPASSAATDSSARVHLGMALLGLTDRTAPAAFSRHSQPDYHPDVSPAQLIGTSQQQVSHDIARSDDHHSECGLALR